MSRERDAYDMFDAPERGRFGDNEADDRRGQSPRVSGASNLIDLNMVRHVDKDRPAAVLVSFGDRTKAVWLPRSQIEILELAAPIRKLRGMIDQSVRITLPNWLAEEKGLV
jgi:hypothetical protein